MSKEQIIIDGIDVAECVYRAEEKCILKDDGCYFFPNCHYKNWQRKEQEYEELRQYHNNCCEENAKKEAEWLEKYNQVSKDFYNGKYCDKENCSLLKTKEQECEELKKYLNQIRDEELSHLDIEWDEYETSARQEDYSNIITLVERALGEIDD